MSGNLFATSAAPTGEWLTAHCDGGSRGNPGPSAYGAVIEDSQGREVARLAKFLGRQTNNFAEYSGLIAVLNWAVENGAKHLRVVSDSELMVKQMKGQYKVQNPGLRPLWEEARRLSRQLDGFEIRHTLRGGNQLADRLANEAMDRGMKRPHVPGTPAPPPLKATPYPTQSEAPPDPYAKADAMLRGFTKDGVVHILGNATLPDGVFVKIIRE